MESPPLSCPPAPTGSSDQFPHNATTKSSSHLSASSIVSFPWDTDQKSQLCEDPVPPCHRLKQEGLQNQPCTGSRSLLMAGLNKVGGGESQLCSCSHSPQRGPKSPYLPSFFTRCCQLHRMEQFVSLRRWGKGFQLHTGGRIIPSLFP